MIIKRLKASFGKLRGAELRLEPGLNIITAPNEAGKSTWCAFIRTMLYGLDTSAKARKDTLPDKTKYRPWLGGEMEGSMDVLYGGRGLTLQRTGQSKAPMRGFSAVYTGTNTAVPGLDGTDAGQSLTGVPESVFVRTAFIGQSAVKVEQSPELEKRISSLVTTGDEQTSFTEAGKRLAVWGRQLSYRSAGSIPELERQLAARKDTLQLVENKNLDAASIREELKVLTQRREALETDLGAFERLEKREARHRLLDAKMKIMRFEAEAERLRQAALLDGRVVTRHEIAAVRDAVRTAESAEGLFSASAQSVKNAEAEAVEAERELAACTFPTEAEATAVLQEADRLSMAVSEAKRIKKRPVAVTVLLYMFLLLSVSGAVLSGGVLTFSLPALIVSAVVAVFCIALLLIKPKMRDTGAQEALNQYLSRYGVSSLGELRSLAERDESARENAKYLKALHTAAGMSLRSAELAARKAQEAALEEVRAILPHVADLRQASAEAARLDESQSRLEQAEGDYKSAQAVFEVMSGDYDGDLKNMEFEQIRMPSQSREELAAALEKVNRVITDRTVRLGVLHSELKALGDPLVIGGEIAALQEKLEKEKFQLKAVELAMEALREADTEMQTRFSPMLGETAGEFLEKLTGGRYGKLTFDAAFDATVKAKDDAVSRSVLSLSAGTVDQLYLALRLAMCELLLSEGEPCPIILDDALGSFDDERMALALSVLREEAERRQILLFTCHGREAAYFRGDKKVNLLTI